MFVVALVGGSAERDVFAERVAGDDDGGGVGAGVPDDAVEALGLTEEFFNLGVPCAGSAEVGGLGDGVLEGDVEDVGDGAGDAVDVVEAHTERAAGVTDGGFCAEGAEADDLGDAVAAVLLGDVADHFVAAVVGEVHVDVGHFATLGVEEALENEAVFERVDVGDAEAVEDEAAGGATADSLGDALVVGEACEVGDDQEVFGEAGFADDFEFVVEALDVLGGGVGYALVEAGAGDIGEVLDGGLAGGDVRLWELEASEFKLDGAALGEQLGVGHGFGEVGVLVEHVLLVGEVVVLPFEAEAFFVLEGGVGADAEEQVVGVVVAGFAVVGVLGGDEWDAGVAGELDGALEDGFVAAEGVVALDFKVVAVVEGFPVPADDALGFDEVFGFEGAVEFAGGAAREDDDAVAVLLEQFAVDAGAVVEAFEVGAGGELDQVAPALVVLGEEDEVVSGFGGAAGFAVEAATGREVGLHAEQGLDAGGAGGLVEIDCAVEVAVVGDREGLLSELAGAFDEGVDASESVEFAVLGVGVEVSEHGRLLALGRAEGPAGLKATLGEIGASPTVKLCQAARLGRGGGLDGLDRLVKGEGAVEEADGLFGVLGAEEDGNADFAGGDQFDVDARVGEGAEHEGGVAGGGLHAGADQADFGEIVVAKEFFRAEFAGEGLGDFAGLIEIAVGDGEGEVGEAVFAGVLDDGVDGDAGIGEGAEELGGDAGSVGDVAEGEGGDIAVEGDGADAVFGFHLDLLADDGAGCAAACE